MGCPAQVANTMEHFFRVLANNDGFGSATIAKLYSYGIRNIAQIYPLQPQDFVAMGFGNKQAENLVNQLIRSRTEAIEDWRFLAAFGVFRMGLGNCEKLLQHYPLASIFDLTETDIEAVEGFAEKTAAVVTKGFKRIQPLFEEIFALGFNLKTSRGEKFFAPTKENSHPLAGKLIVFTGTMVQGSRDDMKRQAKELGAKVGESVSSKTDFLVIGEKVGATKISAAKEKGVKIITEAEYLELLRM